MNLVQENKGDKEKIQKKENITETELDTQPQTTKIAHQKPSKEEDEEFWKDCITQNLDKEIKTISNLKKKSSGSINLTFNGNESLSNFSPNNISPNKTPRKTTENNGHILSTIEDRLKQMKVKYGEDVIDPTKSPQKIKEKERRKQSVERCHVLYEKAKVKSQVQEMVKRKSVEIKKEKELQECSFKPKINLEKFLNIAGSGKQINPRSLYDRQFRMMITKRERIEQIQKELSVRETDFPFRPKINQSNSEIFSPQNSVINDFLTRNYLVRLENARREKIMKLSKLNEISKSSSKLLKKFNRSSSAESSFFLPNKLNTSSFSYAMKTLHNQLVNLSIKV